MLVGVVAPGADDDGCADRSATGRLTIGGFTGPRRRPTLSLVVPRWSDLTDRIPRNP